MTKKNINSKLGARVIKKKRNPFLNPDGSFDLINKFPGIDYMIYEKERIRKQKRGN